jgi:hypothetical protein
MPSPLLQLRIPQDLADWLEAKYPSRGEVAEYVRQLLTAEQMKEAAAPLVPDAPKRVWKGTAAEWAAFQEGAGFETPEETRILDRMHGITSEATVGEIADALEAEKAKPKTPRKKVTVGDLESDEPIDLMVALKASVEAMKVQGPQRCNRGACTGTINPVSGRCLRCNQTPLKESK